MRGAWRNIRWASSAVGVLLALALLGIAGASETRAQGEEPSPILITIVAPEQVGPGSLMDVLIRYELVDANAGAGINYNILGPCHIAERHPEPPKPTVNAWVPGRDLAAKGVVQIRIQIDPESDGQVIRHHVEVRWGAKSRTFDSQTRIVYVPPTATPTTTPRPQATPTLATPGPTTVPIPTLVLTEVVFLDVNGDPVSSVEANQLIGLRIGYSSSAEIPDLQAAVSFQPDVVNVQGLQQGPEGYEVSGLTLPAGPGAVLDLPIQGRVRPYLEQGNGYELHVTVQFLPTDGITMALSGSPASTMVQVTQPLLVDVQASLEATTVRAGGSLIVRVACRNHGSTPIGPVKLSLANMPAGFAVSPAEQIIERLADKSDTEERLFTIHTPESARGPLRFRAVAGVGDTVIESLQVSAEMLAPMRLALEMSADKSTVQSGGVLNLTVHITNPGIVEVQKIVASIVDVSRNLSALAQNIGSLQPGASRDVTFVVEIPLDLPGDVASTLAAQTVSGDGTLSQSDPLTVSVLCRPRYEVLVQPLAGTLRSGQSVEVTCLVRNTSQCTARELFVTMQNLPTGFAPPAAQKIPELVPGGSRQIVFSLLVPSGFVGDGTLEIAVADGGGNSGRSQSAGLSVTGTSTLSIIAFGLLVLLAVAMVIVGVVLYFRGQ